MATYRFTLNEDRISPGGYLEALTPGANRVIYCHTGSVGLGGGLFMIEEEARVLPGRMRVETGHEGAVLWRFELVNESTPEEVEGVGAASKTLHEMRVELAPDEAADRYLFCCDARNIPQGGGEDGYRPPGTAISALFSGKVRIVVGNVHREVRDGEAWGETDDADLSLRVPATDGAAKVVRVAILPIEAAESLLANDPTHPHVLADAPLEVDD